MTLGNLPVVPDVILPCLDEAAALPWVLARMPAGYRAIVADNGSTDPSAAIAAEWGALVVPAAPRGFGAAAHAGLRRTLVVHGAYPAPPGWHVVPQRGDGLGDRAAHAFADTARPGVTTLLVGMDTPQLSLVDCPSGNALGLAEDGGWWALQLENPADASVLRTVPMSTSDTGALTLAALQQRGLSMALLPVLRDVDTAEDAHAVAALCPNSRFSRTVHAMVPSPSGLR